MKIIGLQESFVTADAIVAWRALDPRRKDVADALPHMVEVTASS